MSGVTDKSTGEVLYLEAQLYDEEDSLPLVVKALAYSGAGVLLGTFTMAHTEKGIFVQNLAVMPNEPVLFVKYYVFENDGVTPKTDDYGIIGEKFVTRVLSEVVNVIGSPIEGEVLVTTEVTGTITEICADLEGEIQDLNNLEGEIQSIEPLVGEVINE